MIMSIIGPRETHDCREFNAVNLLSAGFQSSPQKKIRGKIRRNQPVLFYGCSGVKGQQTTPPPSKALSNSLNFTVAVTARRRREFLMGS